MEVSRPELDRNLETIASEIEGFLLSGGVIGVFAVVVMKDGDVISRQCYIQGGKFPLIAGVALAESDLLAQAKCPIHGQG